MANMNVRNRLAKISSELRQVTTHILNHSGVNPKDAMAIDNLSTAIAEYAAAIAAEARAAAGQRDAQKLVPSVRKALGFTYP